MRRLAEVIYESRSALAQHNADDVVSSDQSPDGQFFRSPDVHIRLLSTLIILRTVNQGRQRH